MTAAFDIAIGSAYPGGLLSPDWQLLWIQNVLLVFVQLTTGATLYAQDDRYTRWLTSPVGRVTNEGGRRLTLLVHAGGGLALVAVNGWFTYRWTVGRSGGVLTLVGSRPTITLSTGILTAGFALMAVLGASLYAELTPGTRLPVWRFGYARSRKLHRGVFVLIVGVLGYHVFLTPRVTAVWTAWIGEREPFGLLALAQIGVWGVLAGQSLLMLGEWATGDTYTRWAVDRTRLTGSLGAAVAVGAALERSLLGFSVPVFSIGFVVAVILGHHLLRNRRAARVRSS